MVYNSIAWEQTESSSTTVQAPPQRETIQYTISSERWSEIVKERHDFERQIADLQRQLYVAKQMNDRFRYCFYEASNLLADGAGVLTEQGNLAMGFCQKIQRGDLIASDEISDAWLSATDLLRGADTFRHHLVEWSSQLSGVRGIGEAQVQDLQKLVCERTAHNSATEQQQNHSSPPVVGDLALRAIQ